jgi:putative ABC transport system permease protein
MQTLLQDLRYGLRMLAKNPGFTAVAVLTLALGIGANTAIFSVVYGVLLRPLPYPKPDQIVSVSEVAANGNLMNFADLNFRDLRAANHTLAGMAKGYDEEVTVSGGAGSAQRVNVAVVSRDFFRVMGVEPLLGRGFSEEELREGGPPATLASYGYWQQYLGRATDLSSFKLRTEDHIFSVVGVLPPGFRYPSNTELWLPAELFGDQSPSRTAHNWGLVVGRLRDGVTVSQARVDLATIARRLHEQYKPDIDMVDMSVLPLRDALTGSVRTALLILLGCVGFLLLVASANVANLLIARAAARERELAIRVALGAGRARLVRQFLTESLLLSLAGGALGVLAAEWGASGLVALAPRNLPRLEEVSVSLPALAFALGVSFAVAMGLGTLTAWRATGRAPHAALTEGGRGQAGSRGSQRLGGILVAGQLAITLVLLTGAGLLGRSLLRLLSVDPGFRTENILTTEMEVPGSGESLDVTKPAGFINSLFDRLRALPGVEEVGGASDLPLAEGGPGNGGFLLLDRQPSFPKLDLSKPGDLKRWVPLWEQLWRSAPSGEADYSVASQGFFRALGIPLVRGRLFDGRDTAEAPHVAVISQSLARATWPNQDPLGKTIEFGNMDGDMRLLKVVGVVGDVRDRSLEKPPRPTVYVNYLQRLHGGRDFTVVIRARTPANVLPAEVLKIVHDLDPEIAPRFQIFQDVFSASLERRQFNLRLVGVFAGSALLLAAVGIYGVMAYWVWRRIQEIGVRMALGAVTADVLGLVLGQGSRMIAAGVALGVAGSFALTRLMQSLLYGVSATDWVTFALAAGTLVAVALAASYVPAHRASKVDPMVALRHE